MATATVSTASVPITTVEHPLRNPNYRLWLVGGTISLLGDQLYLVPCHGWSCSTQAPPLAMGAIMMAGVILSGAGTGRINVCRNRNPVRLRNENAACLREGSRAFPDR